MELVKSLTVYGTAEQVAEDLGSGEKQTSGPKGGRIFRSVMARLKSCPDTKHESLIQDMSVGAACEVANGLRHG